MTPSAPAPQPASPAYRALVAAVRRFGARHRRRLAALGAARAVLLGPGLLLAWFALDWAIGLPAWPLLLSFIAICAIGLWALGWHLARPWLVRIRTEREALRIEQLHGGLDNQLIGALQLGAPGVAASHSNALVDALVARAERSAAGIDPSSLLDPRPLRRALAGAAAVLAGLAVAGIFAQSAIALRRERLADAYAIALDALFPVTLNVTPGDVAILRGTPVTLSVEVAGAHRSGVELLRRPAADLPEESSLLALVDGRASSPVAAVERDFTYAFRYGRRRSADFRVRVGDRAELAAITYDISYPAYTGMPARTVVGRVPQLQALSATGVQVNIAATAPLHPELSYVEWSGGGRQPLTVTGRFAGFSFTVEKPERLSIHLCGALGAGFEMAAPVELAIGVDRDRAPLVEALVATRSMTMLAAEAEGLAVPWRAEDDFGVTEVAMEYRIETIDPELRREPRSGTVPRMIEPARDRVKDVFAGAFAKLSPALAPGDRITVTITAKDNNTESGPGIGRSQPLEIVVVSPDLSSFAQQDFGFGSDVALRGLSRVKRNTDLLIEPEKTVRAEAARTIERKDLSSRVGQEGFPSGSEEAVGDYFRLLSGEQ